MAKIIESKGGSTYDSYRKKELAKRILSIIIMVVGIFLAYFTKGISLILALPFFIIRKGSAARKKILLAGEAGEKKTTGVLKKLPRKYFVLEDVTIHKAGGKNQLDHVIIGPNGIFTVETKHHLGKITGDDSDFKVLQQKTTASGKKYSSRFLNPTLQVETHVRAIKRALKPTLYKELEPIGIVYFSNSKSKVKLKSDKMPIFANTFFGRYRLRRYVRKYPSGIFLDINDRKELVSLFR